jgi:hypothetical protein
VNLLVDCNIFFKRQLSPRKKSVNDNTGPRRKREKLGFTNLYIFLIILDTFFIFFQSVPKHIKLSNICCQTKRIRIDFKICLCTRRTINVPCHIWRHQIFWNPPLAGRKIHEKFGTLFSQITIF